jgi:hypothetical protein
MTKSILKKGPNDQINFEIDDNSNDSQAGLFVVEVENF